METAEFIIRVIFANRCPTHGTTFAVPSWCQLCYSGGPTSSSCFLDGFEFQLKSAQVLALSPSELKTAAVRISSCQAKQLRVELEKTTLAFDDFSGLEFLPFQVLLTNVLMLPLGQSSPHSSRFLLNFPFHFARFFCYRGQAMRY